MGKGEEQFDVVVVGAGLSGVVAARLLRQAGKRIAVLEGSPRVGGRLLTSVGEHGLAVDRGGQWIGPGQNRILNLIAEHGFETHPTVTAGKMSFELEGSFGASRLGFPLNRPLVLAGSMWAMHRLERLVAVRAKDTGATSRSDTSLGEFVEREVWPAGARAVLRTALEGIFCRNVDEVSLDLALYAIGSSGGFAHMQAVKGGAQERQVVRGAGTFVTHLAAEFRDCIHLESVVRKIERQRDSVVIHTGTRRLHARRVILAIPPPLISSIEFEPALPRPRQDLFDGCRVGSVIKYNLIYPTAFWRKSNLSGALWSTSGPINVCYDTTPHGTACGVLTALSVAGSAERLSVMPPDERRSAVLSALASHLGDDARSPLDYFDRAWEEESLIGGGYSVTLRPGGFALGASGFRDAEPPLHFAGTETASEYPGYMEGAVEAGERAAQEVLAELRS